MFGYEISNKVQSYWRCFSALLNHHRHPHCRHHFCARARSLVHCCVCFCESNMKVVKIKLSPFILYSPHWCLSSLTLSSNVRATVMPALVRNKLNPILKTYSETYRHIQFPIQHTETSHFTFNLEFISEPLPLCMSSLHGIISIVWAFSA